MEKVSIVIIGAGIIGLATALELTIRYPGISLVVLEKEATVAAHQTGHNSGVIHSGIYYKPGSLKAKLCVLGARRMIDFCSEHSVPYELCGKLIVATHESELPQLEELYRRGAGNGLKRLELLSAAQIREIEPFAAGIRGIHVPGTGIVDYSVVAFKMAELMTNAGGSVRTSHRVLGLNRTLGKTIVTTNAGEFEADLVINCAGLQSDRISRLAGANLDLQIVPFRGEYYDLVPEKHYMVRGLIYPVPDPQFPFLGFTSHAGSEAVSRPAPMPSWRCTVKDTVKDLSPQLTFCNMQVSPDSGGLQRSIGECLWKRCIAPGARRRSYGHSNV